MENRENKVGLIGLIAIVFGSMVGSGVFNIPQNIAHGAALGAVVISWIISGIGIWFLIRSFAILSDQRQDIKSDIYAYAEEGFGKYVGFNAAWGYWLCAAFGNVAFAVMLNDAFGSFFPILLNHSKEMIIVGSVFIWIMNFLSMYGTRNTAFLNTISTIAKFIGLIAIVGLMLIYTEIDNFNFDIWGSSLNLGSVSSQIKSTMMVTLWCFIGIEGAVVISTKAKKREDVSKATAIGFFAALVIYVLISVLSFGLMKQPDLAQLITPSTGGVIANAVGEWGVTFVNICVIFSILGAWIAWTILVAEVPSQAAKNGVMPTFFDSDNKHGAPKSSLIISSIVIQITLLCVVFAQHVYLAAINIAGVMILPTYFLSSLFLVKEAYNRKIYKQDIKKRRKAFMIGFLSSIYCAWLMYAAGLNYILMSSIFYAIGFGFYYQMHKKSTFILTYKERILAAIFIFIALIELYLLFSGKVSA
ncbi:basic amino acid/polyamine antiporter [Flammeovirga kamogawensis]|uniref:Basic amino acid/polyamine antiporter n=1 Tax=Flammeovirga kamogawensis TaxID=373891 RepID=A0ABX8GX79_9BACT|nr:basic amino acid/polyamine antiporter [Flammeovirga kamogawensis]MBB6460569.1 arginine:ornithine antiporter/lysine permease [Flammeovirga kamogawensis]QWG07928.1 basic amino acid/polyamine antiporter [Flammeovirga kamogawensis]TRX69735.1 amino acid permease [Flammeovirga kamogawensis]